MEAAAEAVGATQGRLRAAHLRAHLAMVEVLTPGQLRAYAELRGYGGQGAPGHGGHKP